MPIRSYVIFLPYSYNDSSQYLIKIVEESPEIARGKIRIHL